MLNQPISQVKLTNVAIIKYKVSNCKFEIACYKNKAINWRNGVEKDIEEVLQIDGIFTNVQQGNLAKKKDLQKIFGTCDKNTIIKQILDHGQLQVSDKERDVQADNTFKEIVNIISEKTIHQISQRPLSTEAITQALKDLQFKVKLDKPPKKQALQLLKQMQKKYLVARAMMKLRVNCPISQKDKFLEEISNQKAHIVTVSESSDRILCDFLIKPSKYRKVDEIVKNQISESYMEILDHHHANRETIRLDDAENINLQLRDQKLNPYLSSSSESDSEKPSKEDQVYCEPAKKKLSRKENRRAKAKAAEMKKAQDEEEKLNQPEPAKDPVKEEAKLELDTKKFKCTTCLVGFDDNAEFKKHWRSDWHLFNIKRKSEVIPYLGQSKPVLSEKEYLNYLLEMEFESTL